jgi:GNAT superfamily N-acetyltransferase
VVTYLNHTVKGLTGRSGSRAFMQRWWPLYADDSRWTPPFYPLARWALRPDRNPHLARFQPLFVYVEALPRRQPQRSADPQQTAFSTSLFEIPTAAAVVLTDPRRHDGTAYLALARWINDPASVRAMFNFLPEQLAETRLRRLVGPTGLAPSWGGGLLVDHWDRWPPQDTPYNPPYLPELLARGQPAGHCHLFHLPVSDSGTMVDGPAELVSLPPKRMVEVVPPLLVAATDPRPELLPPDELEAAFLLRWLNLGEAQLWVAQVEDRPVGFVALGPDWAGRLRRARGGRKWLWRAWLAATSRLAVPQGRILAGGVLPDWRGQGIGRQLLAQATRAAGDQGWRQITIGPLAGDSRAARFLGQAGAAAGQRYELRKWSLPNLKP